MKSPAKILFIGIDAGEKDLILAWAREGKLPAIGGLLDKGVCGITESPEGFYVGAIWPSFMTALSPAKHRRYCLKQIQTGTYRTRRFETSHLKGDMFWDTLSRAGRRVAVLDVPKAPLSNKLNGIQIMDWATHDAEEPRFNAFPQSFRTEIETRFGHDEIGSCDVVRQDPEEFIALRDALISRTRKKGELSRFFLRQGGWDLFMTVFCESHCAGHQFWHLIDTAYPRHDPAVAQKVGNPLLDVYRQIDSEIGQLVAEAGPGCRVFLFASHGMGPHYEATFMLDTMLRRLDTAGMRKRRNFSDKVRLYLRKKIEHSLKRRFGNRYRYQRSLCTYFKVPNNTVFGGVRINVAGREPFGWVRPGRDYEETCAALTADLMTFVNQATGKPLVKRILRSRDLFPGEKVDHLPDLLVEWNREANIETVYSPKTGVIRKSYNGCRTGDHKREGCFIASGPGVRAGQFAEPVSVTDIAPTLAAMLDTSLPQVEGRSFLEKIRSKEKEVSEFAS